MLAFFLVSSPVDCDCVSLTRNVVALSSCLSRVWSGVGVVLLSVTHFPFFRCPFFPSDSYVFYVFLAYLFLSLASFQSLFFLQFIPFFSCPSFTSICLVIDVASFHLHVIAVFHVPSPPLPSCLPTFSAFSSIFSSPST